MEKNKKFKYHTFYDFEVIFTSHESSVKIISCTVCDKRFQSILVLLRHVTIFHSAKELKCNFQNCFEKFDSTSELQSHVFKCNKADSKLTFEKTFEKPAIKKKSCVFDFKNFVNDPVQSEIFKIIYKLQSSRSMPANKLDSILKDMANLTRKTSNYFQVEVKKLIPVEYHKKIDKVFEKIFFENCDSEYKRINFFKDSKCFIPPDSFCIGNK